MLCDLAYEILDTEESEGVYYTVKKFLEMIGIEYYRGDRHDLIEDRRRGRKPAIPCPRAVR
ncbi:hypothetical protein [Mesorhizobium sp. Cs1321R2N1]|uniref:hypothetical protein n=1 Tax=Mesorhizobium sp. Cs1321R2N1 TaxID=3015174 RepID=UPI00301E0682